MEEERADCFSLIFSLMSCGDCYCSVALSHAVVGWSAVYYGIYGLYLFTFSMA